MTDAWSDVRKAARRAETELGQKMDALRGLSRSIDAEAARLEEHRDGIGRQGHSAGSVRYDVESNSFEQEAVLSSDVEASLKRYARVMETMQSMALDGGSRRQQLARYQDIYHDHKMEFAKLCSKIQRQRQRAELFGHVEGDSQTDDSARDHLLRERKLLAEASQQGQEILSKAEAAYTGLREQGNSLFGVASRMTTGVIGRFPMIGNLVERVRRRKQRDQIIMAILLGFFVFFTLWYIGFI